MHFIPPRNLHILRRWVVCCKLYRPPTQQAVCEQCSSFHSRHQSANTGNTRHLLHVPYDFRSQRSSISSSSSLRSVSSWPTGAGSDTPPPINPTVFNESVLNDVIEMFQDWKMEDKTMQLYMGVKNKERASLSRAITLVESTNPQIQRQAQLLLTKVLLYMKDINAKSEGGLHSFRIGLSGPPGAGKSTFIETLGKFLTKQGHRVAVLAVDPSSSTTGGSLLADKTRMPQLSVDPNAFIRPSPARGSLGGVARNTNEAIVLCEGAGFDIVIVETVGVGQSEFAVADMVDLFCLLIPPAGGDELQGIKRGIVEVSDIVVVNKSDGDLEPAAKRIQAEYLSALKFMRQRSKVWRPQVLRASALTGFNVDKVWETTCNFRKVCSEAHELKAKRDSQLKVWMWSQIRDRILDDFRQQPEVIEKLPDLERMVEAGNITPGLAADVILDKFFKNTR